MYLAELTVTNFRRLKKSKLFFSKGLNVIVGPNNIGKTAVVDALRALLAGADDPYPRFTTEDIHRPKAGAPTGDIEFDYVFRDLSSDDEADFMHALREDTNGNVEALLSVSYGEPDKAGRLRYRRWCGANRDLAMTQSASENLRSVYLQPLRDAEQGLRPSRNSQLSRLLHLLADESGRESITEQLVALDKTLKTTTPISDTQKAIIGRHKTMLGEQLAQALELQLSGSDFAKLEHFPT